MVNLNAKCKNLKIVKPTSFYPPPKIYSSIVAITKKNEIMVDNYDDFSNFIRLLFMNKKKTIRTILRNIIKRKEKENLITEREFLDSLQFMDRRVFTMSLDELISLYNLIKESIGEESWLNIISPNIA